MRDTSKEAYQQICANGLLQQRQLETYEILYRFGPLTRNEIDERGCEEYGVKGVRANPPWSRRLADMERMGVIRRVGQRSDPTTNFLADLWDVTSALPVPIPKNKRFTKKQKHAALKRLLVLTSEKEEPTLGPLVDWLAEEVTKRSKKSNEEAAPK